MTTAQVPFPKREALYGAVTEVLAQYAGTPVTLRQLYYRLVAAGTIPNNLRAYKNVGAALTEWRRARKVPMNALEDRTRGMDRFDKGWRTDDPLNWLKVYLEAGVREARNYNLARWYGQENRVVVLVEKQALEGPFARVCKKLGVDLAVCRGYPSISFLSEIAGALSKGDRDQARRHNVLLYFGDLDPSGMNIPETVERDLGTGLFRKDFEFHRIALTHEHVEEMSLIPAPVKMGDSRARGFVAEHGEEVYELDAIDPKRLSEIIRDAVDLYWDEDAFNERAQLVAAGREQIAEKLTKAGVIKFLKGLGSTDADVESTEPKDEDSGDDDEVDG